MKKLVVISSRFPYPLDKGDKLRLFHQLRYLHAHYEIYLFSLDDTGAAENYKEELLKYCEEVNIYYLSKWRRLFNLALGIFTSKPFQVHYFYSRSIHKKIQKSIGEIQPDHIYCQLLRASEYVKNEHSIPKTIDYMDAFSKGIERRIENSGWKRYIFRSEFKRLIGYENIIYEYFDGHTIISEEDRNFIYHPKRDKIHIVSNGIDYSFFTPEYKESVNKKHDVVLVGNMSYAPNIAAAKYIVNEIKPLIESKGKSLKVLIAGASPSPEVLSLKQKDVEISGWIDDIRDAYASSKIFLAPMKIGTGLQNKLLEAMAMEMPCVTSELVNKSLKAAPEEEILLANSTEEYATHILALLENMEKSKALGVDARIYVTKNFSWKETVTNLADIIENSNI